MDNPGAYTKFADVEKVGVEGLRESQTLLGGRAREDQLCIVNQFKKAVTMIFKKKSNVQLGMLPDGKL
jgi:hypothetical protein